MTDLAGKRVLVTGAGQGMGRAIAIEAARQGAQSVVVTDVNVQTGQETAELVSAAGAQSMFVAADLRQSDQIQGLITAAVDWADGLDTLVNNAGVLDSQLTEHATLEGLDEAAWDAVMDVNIKAVWLMTKFAAPALKASDRGPSIVNSASVSGVHGTKAGIAYGASKAAVIHFTKSSALYFAPTVRVNCYLPGMIQTPMALGHIEASPDPVDTIARMTGAQLIPRPGDPYEVAALACFLASDRASFITGGVYPVDGGMLAWRGVRS